MKSAGGDTSALQQHVSTLRPAIRRSIRDAVSAAMAEAGSDFAVDSPVSNPNTRQGIAQSPGARSPAMRGRMVRCCCDPTLCVYRCTLCTDMFHVHVARAGWSERVATLRCRSPVLRCPAVRKVASHPPCVGCNTPHPVRRSRWPSVVGACSHVVPCGRVAPSHPSLTARTCVVTAMAGRSASWHKIPRHWWRCLASTSRP